jgi:hypothetical protein
MAVRSVNRRVKILSLGKFYGFMLEKCCRSKNTMLIIVMTSMSISFQSIPLGKVLATNCRKPAFLINPLKSCRFFKYKEIQINNEQVVLAKNLQAQLKVEILKAQLELDNLSEKFSIKFDLKIGLVYFHEGQDDWSINFTFGGLILEASQKIILKTPQVFELQEAFKQTKWVSIEGETYQTTGVMRHKGGILHEDLHQIQARHTRRSDRAVEQSYCYG